jgi:hypothetical protein
MVGSREFVRPEALKAELGKKKDRTGVGPDASNGRPRDRGGEGDLVPRAARGSVSQGRRDQISSERGGTEVLVGDGSIDSGCRAVERPPMPSHADGANLSASLRFRPRRSTRVP